jgi:hypothetical protein
MTEASICEILYLRTVRELFLINSSRDYSMYKTNKYLNTSLASTIGDAWIIINNSALLFDM